MGYTFIYSIPTSIHMQTLEFANKKDSNNIDVVSKETNPVEELNKRESHGTNIALTRNVFYLLESKDNYYVQSEHSDNIYYFVKYNPDVIEYCNCPDYSIRLLKIKHIWSIEKSIVKGTLKEIDKLPVNAKQFTKQPQSKSWRNDSYDY